MKKVFILLTVLLSSLGIAAQHPCWVQFTDKSGVSFDAEAYFVPKALQRYSKQGIDPNSYTNRPVKNAYIRQIAKIADSTGYASRWFNILETYATPAQRRQIAKLPFVSEIRPFRITTKPAAAYSKPDSVEQKAQRALIRKQTRHLEGHLFRKNGYTGKGVRIAIFDGGFRDVDKHPAFSHINRNNRIIKTWDYPEKDTTVFEHHRHGTAVLSCIAGMHDTLPMGLATHASFLLARTEVRTEPFSEEKNWLAAAEWADKNGADIINSSLGYTYHRYFPEEMDGHQSLVAKAATMAARKGILVVNSMGNSATNPYWKIVGTPADADSVLSVAGISPVTSYHTSFSSLGPTADMRLKPNVTAIAHVIAANPLGYGKTQGTSFSSPLVAGFAACALQTHPELTAMQLFHEIEKSGHLYPYFDYAHGYGIPKASYFLKDKQSEPEPTFTFSRENEHIVIRIDEKFIDLAKSNNYLYYHIEKPNTVLKKYGLIRVMQSEAYKIPLKLIKQNNKLKVHYKGFTKTYAAEEKAGKK